MSAHWYWDWDWGRKDQRQGRGEHPEGEEQRVAGAAATEQTRLPATGPAITSGHHPPHQPKEDAPFKKNLGNKPCLKQCIFVQTGPDAPDDSTKPPGDHWELFRLWEFDEKGRPVNDHAFDEWYWVRCYPRPGCCKKGVAKLKVRVQLLKQDSGGGPIYVEDFKCRCKEIDDDA